MQLSAEPDLPVEPIRQASRRLVRELGFLRGTLAGTALPPSAVHALVEIGARGSITAAELAALLVLEKSSVSRMLRKLIDSGDLATHRDGRAKPLTLTPRGRKTLAGIDAFARRQVTAALRPMPAQRRRIVRDGLAAYADALASARTDTPLPPAPPVEITSGYRPGVIGRTVEMHAHAYAAIAGFGRVFEAKVAAGLADFADRLDNPRNALWTATQGGTITGTIAIDGEDLGPGIAHLRWFIVEGGQRGAGIGRRLLTEALAFCDRHGFAETRLWTFRGLDAARRLYEGHGFTLAEQHPGRQWGAEVMEQLFIRQAIRP